MISKRKILITSLIISAFLGPIFNFIVDQKTVNCEDTSNYLPDYIYCGVNTHGWPFRHINHLDTYLLFGLKFGTEHTRQLKVIGNLFFWTFAVWLFVYFTMRLLLYRLN